MERVVAPAVVIAQFIVFYGAAEYRGPQWPTRDHVIPWRRFLIQYAAMRHVMALQRLNQSRAVSQGVAMAFAKKGDADIQKLIDHELDEAYPSSP